VGDVINLQDRAKRNVKIAQLGAIEDAIEREAAIKTAAKEFGCRVGDLREEVDKVRKEIKQSKQDAKAAENTEQGYSVDDRGNVVPNMANLNVLMKNDPGVKDILYFDDMSNSVMMMHEIGKPEQHPLFVYGEKDGAFPHRITDADVTKLLLWAQTAENGILSKATIVHLRQVIDYRGQLVHRHPLQEWIKEQEWDGEKRVNKAFHRYFGAEDNAYTQEISRVFFLSYIKRIIEPGCKQDYVVALEMKQGVGKSTAARIIALADKFHTDSLQDLHSRDSMMMTQGKTLVELAESHAGRKRDVNAFKADITRQIDECVQKWEKYASAFPRGFIYLITVNDSQYLADPTGNRRILPVPCGKLDLEGLRRDMPQICAEAYARLTCADPEQYWPHEYIEKEFMTAEQEARRIKSNWEARFKARLEENITGLQLNASASVLDHYGIGISDAALSLFFETCEDFRNPVPANTWREVLRGMEWASRLHRLGKDGPRRRFWSKIESGDVLAATLDWRPRDSQRAGGWVLKYPDLQDDKIVAVAEGVAFHGEGFGPPGGVSAGA
jgi:predicted P-loop ATPase